MFTPTLYLNPEAFGEHSYSNTIVMHTTVVVTLTLVTNGSFAFPLPLLWDVKSTQGYIFV